MKTNSRVEGTGVAIASLALGIAAVCSSFLLIGGALALIGLLLGITHLVQRENARSMAWWGVSLSAVGLAATIAFGGLYYRIYQEVRTAIEAEAKDSVWAEWEGKEAPNLRLTTLDGTELAVADLRGKRVVLAFWATWCPPCRMEIPHFNKFIDEFPADQLMIIAISSEEADTVRSFAAKQGIRYRLAVLDDETLPAPFNQIRAIPTTFFIDRQGVIQNVRVGYHDYDALKRLAVQPDFQPVSEPAPAAPEQMD